MLFQRLYNWIKYKTLPPSILFKNRLFVERDSKHKRILNNFGLIFRNSKWTNYETYNIKSQFRLSFYKYIFLFFTIFFTIFFIYNFKKYYICYYFFNILSFLFWISLDSLDYYFSFLVWLFTIALALFSNLAYSYFFFNNFSENKNINKVFSHSFFSDVRASQNFQSTDSFLSKHDANWIFYSWLTNAASEKNKTHLEKIFARSLNKNWWDTYSSFFIKLFKSTTYCTLFESKNSIYEKNSYIYKIINNSFKGEDFQFLKYFYVSDLSTKYITITLSYFINNYRAYFETRISEQKNANFLFFKNKWNLSNLVKEKNNSFLNKNKKGSFFFNDFNFGKLSFFATRDLENLNFIFNISNQVNTAKWNRWLYRYSILHRKLLKNSHKLTLTKKLINSGFYNNSLFDKNLWASENLLKFEKKSDIVNSLFNTFHPSLFNKTFNWNSTQTFNKNNSRNLEFLNFYENSFFWLLKRFYFFNSIKTNKIKNKKIYLNDLRDYTKNNKFENYSLILSFLLKFCKSNELFTNFFIQNSKQNLNEIFEYQTSYLLKDLQIYSLENDLTGGTNLNFFHWIVNANSNNNELAFFNYTPLNKHFINFSIFSSLKNDEQVDYFLFCLLNKNENHDSDLYFLNALLKN